MKFLFFTHDLVVEKWNFMPWKTLVEVVKFINENGHDAELVSLGNANDLIDIDDKKLTIFQIRKSDSFFKQNLKDLVKGRQPDIIYWPLAWRESIFRIKIIGSLGVPLIGYFPGGCYTIGSSIYALKSLGIRTALPYLLESLAPSRLQIQNFKNRG